MKVRITVITKFEADIGDKKPAKVRGDYAKQFEDFAAGLPKVEVVKTSSRVTRGLSHDERVAAAKVAKS